MKYGMNLLLWTGELNDSLLPVLEQLKKIGYDGVEVPIFGGEPSSFRSWGKRLDDCQGRAHGGLTCPVPSARAGPLFRRRCPATR